MRLILSVLLFFIFSCATPPGRSPSSTSLDCDRPIDIFVQEQENIHYRKMQEYLVQRRKGILQSQHEEDQIDLDEVILNQQKYTVLGVLGKSSSKVYLAKNKLGNLVTIKMSMHADDTWLDLTWEYEKYASKFFKAKKLPIVQVLDEGEINGRHVLIKEYRAGLSYTEVQELNWVLPGNFIQKLINKDLQEMRARFMNENDSLRQ
jgi:hypothetical protein